MWLKIHTMACLVVLMLSAVEVQSATRTWNNSSGGSWNDPANWTPNSVPSQLDTAVIGVTGNYEVMIDSGHAKAGYIDLGDPNASSGEYQWLTVGWQSCSLTVNGNVTIHPRGILNIHSGGRFFMADTGATLTDSGQVALILGGEATFGFRDTLHIVGDGWATIASVSSIIGDDGFIWSSNLVQHPDADTGTIAVNYQDDEGSTAFVWIQEGALKFLPPDSAVFNSTVHVDAEAALRCSRCQFKSTSTINGLGTLLFEGGEQKVAGDFPFTGNIHVVSGDVNFDPINPNPVEIDTFTIESGATFTSSVAISAAVTNMNGGTTNANITSNQYNWTAGDYVGGGGTDITVNPGTSLNIIGPIDKVLDTRDLVISGTADMSGSGVFSLLNGASITVNSDGILTIGDSVTITGPSDSLINYGQLTMSSPLDTIVINPFLWNISSGRTPGTIEILDGIVQCENVQNQGTINIHAGATLIVTGSFDNQENGVICGAGTLDMRGSTLVNNGVIAPGSSPGILTITGNLENLGITKIELGGTNPDTQYDRLLISGTLTLSGTLNLSRINGFVPSPTDTFHFLSFGDRSGEFDEVTGTAVSNGTFLEIAYRDNEIVQFVCDGVSDIQISVAAIFDTVICGSTDTLTLQVCNEGYCPLVWSSSYVQHSPANPTWLTIIEGSNGQLERTLCDTIKLVIHTAGLSANTYSGDVVVTSNDPNEAVTTIPVQLVVPKDHVDDLVIRLSSATNSITLVWGAVPGANSYKIYHNEPSSGNIDPVVFLASTADTTYTHTGTLGAGHPARLIYNVVASADEP